MSSNPGTVENQTDSKPNTTKPVQISADYTLPNAVKARIDGNYSLANATAIVSTLFAAVMIGMGQIISQESDTSATWEAVRILVYGSVIANLASAMCSLWVMAMCSDVPQKAQNLAVTKPDSWPAKVVAKKELEGELIQDDYALLKAFGMYDSYAWMEYFELVWLIIGLVSMFSAITLWSWAAQSHTVAGALLIFVIPALICALYPMWFLIRETKRDARAARLSASSSPSP